MSVPRIMAIIFIFTLFSIAWVFLGLTTKYRSENVNDKLGREVSVIWADKITQEAAQFAIERKVGDEIASEEVLAKSSTVNVKLDLDYRKKGLIWYPTFESEFDANYQLSNTTDEVQIITARFQYPNPKANYNGLEIMVDDEERLDNINTQRGIIEQIKLKPGETKHFKVKYRTRGLGEWRYKVNPNHGMIKSCTVNVKTNFKNIDFSEDGGLSPADTKPIDDGMEYKFLATGVNTPDIAILVPEKQNPGPLTSRIILFAPICLFFYFGLIGVLSIVRKLNIHPMHYLFISASFFSFHLLLAYMVDHLNFHISFIIASIVSVLLVNLYLKAAIKDFTAISSIFGQLFFLVLLSYSFFFKGYSALTVAIVAVVLLALVMKVTVHLDWAVVFNAKTKEKDKYKRKLKEIDVRG